MHMHISHKILKHNSVFRFENFIYSQQRGFIGIPRQCFILREVRYAFQLTSAILLTATEHSWCLLEIVEWFHIQYIKTFSHLFYDQPKQKNLALYRLSLP